LRQSIPVNVVDEQLESFDIVIQKIHHSLSFLETSVECFGKVVGSIANQPLVHGERLSF
jgi:hypothetical protein